MLELNNISKSYKTGDFEQKALDGVSLKFRKSEFVAVLGHSGSGKTTLLNIIGGLDRYDSGDLIINGKSTKAFKATDWDAYRNNSIGFVFQSYNLISHISVAENIEMCMTLSGKSASERKRKAMEVLEKVGLKEHAKKRPNQLSGGQMQRVAIARAIANDPDIILADEPTGALDSATSVQIMNLIKEIAKDKLVIMVTHNPMLAEQYATRTVELADGKIVSDSDPVTADEHEENGYTLKKTSMSFLTALKLSFTNIMTKKGRTLLTAFASSIGIIGIALIMSLSNGFDIKISEFEKDMMSEFPIVITRTTMDMTAENLTTMSDGMQARMKKRMGISDSTDYTAEKVVYPFSLSDLAIVHENEISEDFIEYLENIDGNNISGISFTRILGFNLIAEIDGEVKTVSTDSINFTAIPKNYSGTENGVLENNYDILDGSYPQNINETVLVVDTDNRVDSAVLKALGLDYESEKIPFDEIIGLELKLVTNNDYYSEMNGYYLPSSDLDAMWASGDSVTLKISGIVRLKEDSSLEILTGGIAYKAELEDFLLENAEKSDIVKAQLDSDKNVMTGAAFTDASEKTQILMYLGGDSIPYAIMIYPKDFDTKDSIIAYIDAYNETMPDDSEIVYTDMAAMITALSGSIMDAITIVLVAFSSIALIVSVIMIAIITYISVIERTKEIGVLRALGARKKDITRVFNAETFIIGLCSGLMGILIARLLLIPANIILEKLSDLPNIAQMNPVHAAVLIVISLTLTVLGGFIPAKMASHKDPVVALRTE